MDSTVKVIQTFCALLILVCIDRTDCGETQSEILRGVTIRNWPYADRLSGKFEGFVVDIMNEIADTLGFEYRLYFSPDGKYGAVEDNRINGMIGEVVNNRADFAIADIAVTDVRKKYVDFTESFIETGIGILIHKKHAKNIRSFRDLADQTDIKYGTYRMGATSQQLSQSSDPTIRKMYTQMLREPEVFVNNAKEGVDRVNNTNYAFLVEGTFAEFLSGMYCELSYVEDRINYFPRKFAIATPKGSMYTEKFSSEIRKMKKSGQLDKIKARYWRNRCVDSGNNNNNRARSDSRDRPTIKWADKGYDVSAVHHLTTYSSNKLFLSVVLIIFHIYSCFE